MLESTKNNILKFFTVDSSNVTDRIVTLFLVAVAAVVLVFFVNLLSIGRSNFGEWGDFFGGVLNPILTFITFSGLLLTIILQQKELSEAREQFQRSADSLRTTQLQEHFFRSLEMQNTIVDSIDLHKKETNVTTSGRDCFATFYSRFSSRYQDAIKKYVDIDHFKRLAWSFDGFFKDNEQNLSHYFRHLEAIFEFIDGLGVGSHLYAAQLRSTLSNREVLLIFYYCASKKSPRMKVLVEKHALLLDLPNSYIVDLKDIVLISKDAFGNQSVDGKPRFSELFRGVPHRNRSNPE